MRRHLEILIAIALSAFGLAVVRPRVPELYEAAWQPVLEGATKVAAESYGKVELEGGEYVVFLEGPELDPHWERWGAAPPRVELFDGERALPAIERGLGYEYRVDDRRGLALSQVSVERPGSFELGELEEQLGMPGWRLSLCLSGPVQAASRRGQAVMVAGAGLGLTILMVVVLVLLRRGLDMRSDGLGGPASAGSIVRSSRMPASGARTRTRTRGIRPRR